MDKQYNEIKFKWGFNIESAVNELLAHHNKGELVYGVFNGTKLYSDTVTMDDAYKSITGLNKSEFDDMLKRRAEEHERQEREHKAQIHQLTKFWVEQAKGVVDDSKLELWEQIVPARLDDLYKGMELGNCLEIIKHLNNDDFEAAKTTINNQCHSGMSFSLVRAMVREFSTKGEKFVEY